MPSRAPISGSEAFFSLARAMRQRDYWMPLDGWVWLESLLMRIPSSVA